MANYRWTAALTLGLIIGDAVHNLRAALDHLASGEDESEGSGGASPDMSGISERLCQEAGIIY